jgi:hypothetical protein
MNSYFYDVESYSNLYTFAFIQVKDRFPLSGYIEADLNKDVDLKMQILNSNGAKLFIIHKSRNDLASLVKFIRNTSILVGFNNRSFDDNIVDYILINEKSFSKLDVEIILSELYLFTQQLLDNSFFRYSDIRFKRYIQPYRSVDLYKVLRLDYSFTGLKQVAVNLKWYRIQDLPINPHSKIKDDEVSKVIDYNFNDVLITRELYFKELDEVIQRFNATSIYGTDYLASSRSSMADSIMMKLYCDASGFKPWEVKDLTTNTIIVNFKDIISPVVKFESYELNTFLDHIKSVSINVISDKFKETIIYKGASYTFAKGGIHTNDKPGLFKSNDDYVYMDADVTSFYPQLILRTRAVPKHLDADSFLKVFKTIVDERIKYKKAGDPMADILKLVINSVYGKFGYQNMATGRGWLYDISALFKVTINGQLLILSLAEKLANRGFATISANTDGVLAKVKRDRLEEYYKVCNDWSFDTGFNLEYATYKTYIRLSVNDYVAELDNGSFKYKSFFNTKFDAARGYNMPVVPKAVIKYFFEGVKPEDYIPTVDDIYEFCTSIKTGEQFVKELLNVSKGELTRTQLPKTVRYYCSIDGGSIIKNYTTKSKSISMAKNRNITLFNDYSSPPYNIDYKFYIRQAYENIYRILNLVTKDIKGTPSKPGRSGNLFDNVET